MIRSLIIVGGMIAFLAAFGSARPGDDVPKKLAPPSDSKEGIMQRKLAQAQKLLEGLALYDFAKIKAACDELTILRQKAEWMALKTREYEVYTNDFQRQIESMQKAAKNKNIDGATLAYVNMTLTCVACHKYVRETVVAEAPTHRDAAWALRK